MSQELQRKRFHLLLSSREQLITVREQENQPEDNRTREEHQNQRTSSEPGNRIRFVFTSRSFSASTRLRSSSRRLVPGVRKSGLMSASVLRPCLCGRVSLVCGLLLLLLASSPLLAAGRLSNCTHPLVPEHGGFRCDPSPCRGFPQKSSIHFFCEPGYHLTKTRVSRCRQGRWQPPVPACIPIKDSPHMNPDDASNDSMPSMATTAVGVSIFLLTTTACLVVKSRLYPCQSHSRRSSDQLDLMVDGLPVSLPSYEEAVYGSWGQRLPACSAPGPTQLLLAQEAPGHPQSDGSHRPLLSSHSPDNPPPPYEAVQSLCPAGRMSEGEGLQLHVPLSDDKDT
ncbi:sushi domain-containing protein 4 isoform X2 [Hippoglossus hippoglossus]|uniref:sushi domain-containing protein 4 isoform X2 n=1 Tax=Hippoglossus hippoglossus TaxID=8267 RepID=UPI00148E3CF7|nr:sushi domain-containing protein 4 isoform X2 [Hippoglossus hippoglossus]